MEGAELNEKIRKDRAELNRVLQEASKIIIGQKEVLNSVLRGILANGHILMEGVPGIAKTLIVRTLSKIMGCQFSRIQFTPDLLPTDIIGISTYEEERGFYVLKGPIFANFILADEINRAPPKVQSALLEGMQEKQATIGKETFELPYPFFVLATQNPLESLGTFPLPEAQIDRFMFKLNILYPEASDEEAMLRRNTMLKKFEEFDIQPVLSPEKIMDMQDHVRMIYLDSKIEKYIVRIVDATRNPSKYKIHLGKYVEWGSSPRGSLSLFISSKAEAFLQGKSFVTPFFVKKVAPDVLRHRIILNFEGQSEGVSADDVVKEILEKVPVP